MTNCAELSDLIRFWKVKHWTIWFFSLGAREIIENLNAIIDFADFCCFYAIRSMSGIDCQLIKWYKNWITNKRTSHTKISNLYLFQSKKKLQQKKNTNWILIEIQGKCLLLAIFGGILIKFQRSSMIYSMICRLIVSDKLMKSYASIL